MKARKRFKTAIAVLLLTVMLPMTMIPSSATPPSPPTTRFGGNACGVLFPDNIGLVIEDQTVTYDITSLPTLDDDDMLLGELPGGVRTDYSLYNPTSEQIDFEIFYQFTSISSGFSYVSGTDAEAYAILIDGQTAEARLEYDTSKKDVDPALREAIGMTCGISIAAGDRAVVSLTAPIYPNIETEYEPYTYEYFYDIACENAGLFTGQIHVRLNTPYYLVTNGYQFDFEKTEYGYSLTIQPREYVNENLYVESGGFFFTLCESESPEKIEESSGLVFAVILVLIIHAIMQVIDAVKNTFKTAFGFKK